MKIKTVLLIILTAALLCTRGGAELNMRPRELQFYVDSHLTSTTLIEYNKRGDVVKMSSFEKNRLTDYARYIYTTEGRLSAEKTFDTTGVLVKTRKYFYDEPGHVTGEKVYSPDGKLLEYTVISYSGKKIRKADYYRPDDNIYQAIEFNYTDDILSSVVFHKTGKYIMIMKPVYDKNMLLTGHSIAHSNADVKIETKYIYEEGYATEETMNLIFR